MADWDVVGSKPAQASDPWAVRSSTPVMEGWTGKDLRNQAVQDTLDRLKNAGNEAVSIADLVLGIPSFMVTTGASLGGAVVSAAAGEDDPIARGRETGRRAGELGPVRAGTNPLRKIVDMFRSGEAPQSITDKGMEKLTGYIDEAGKWVQEQTGGRVSADAVPMFVETLMAGSAGLAKGRKPGTIDPAMQKRLREHAQGMRDQAEAEIATARAQELTPAEQQVRAPVQQQINDLLGIRTPQEQAQRTRERRKDITQAFERGPAEGPLPPNVEARGTRRYGSRAESEFRVEEQESNAEIYNAERNRVEQQNLLDEAPEGRIERERPLGQADILDILQKPGFERTAEDLIKLRAARQKGGATPEAMALMGAAGLGALVGANLDDNALRGATLGGLTMAAAAAPHMFRGASLGRQGRGQRGGMGIDTRSVTDALMTEVGGTDRGKWTAKTKKDAADAAALRAAGRFQYSSLSPEMRAKYEQAAKVLRGEMEEPGAVLAGKGSPFAGPGRGQTGAVKAPGGMWHPEAVERLATPLKDKLYAGDFAETAARLANDPEYGGKGAAKSPTDLWSEKAVKNYLNKYAGTERDPLKDVEIPQGVDTIRWETLWDQVIKDLSKENTISNRNFPPGARAGEPVWDIANYIGGGRSTSPNHAITTYLSHVGDYLRQNVEPGKLQQYDLVRAVRETAENDRRVAKEMEKAAAASTKDLPVYKEYPDGMRWVELKLPEKLTPEQQKSVRELTAQEIWSRLTPEVREEIQADLGLKRNQVPAAEQLRNNLDDYNLGSDYGKVPLFEAIDSNGKPIRNSYTNEIAGGETPQKAYLAGRLAEEGNQMGHCVGGYCEGVAAGKSKIYSLRDKKGQSHVTVETLPFDAHRISAEEVKAVGPKGVKALRQFDEFKQSYGSTLGSYLEQYHPEVIEAIRQEKPYDIGQIKGKQNRAPNAQYLPYVQDFVKEGKWGEVGDFNYTGLQDLKETGRNSSEFRALAEELFPGQRFLNEAESRKLQDEGVSRTLAERDKKLGLENGRGIQGRLGPGERGSIDQQLLMGMGALGLGGIIAAEVLHEPGDGELLGALAAGALGIPLAKSRLKRLAEVADYGLGNISTRLGNISEPLKLRARQFEMRNLIEAHERLTKVVPFMEQMKKLESSDPKIHAALERALLTNEREGISLFMRGKPELIQAWREARNVLQELGSKLMGHGRFRAMKEEYWPRVVKDLPGLMEALDKPLRNRLEKLLADADQKAMQQRGAPLDNIEKSAIINREIAAVRNQRTQQPGYAKARGVDEVTESLREYYFSPVESLYAYVRQATTDLETARFFGKDLVQRNIKGQNFMDIDASIGNVIGEELKAGKITHEQAMQAIEILKSRFKSGDRSPNEIVQVVRNLGNMGLLGNIVSAATQAADSLMSIYSQGLRSTLGSMARQLGGNEKLKAGDFGLADHLAEEFVSTSRTAQWLNNMFKYSGFAAIDRFGKTTMLDAALEKAMRQAGTERGVKDLERKYGEAFGKEFPLLARDLRAGNISERVRLLAFSELADMQPISKMEMPQAYLDHPNGRLMYMLKTFMLKQMDVVRRDVVQEFTKGNRARALKNATSYALVLGIAGASTDMIKNWLMGRPVSFGADDVMENVLKTFGWSSYALDKVKQGKPIEALMGIVAPPYKMMDDIIRLDPRAVQYIPLVGKLYYNWELGGREEAELRDARKAKREGREVSLSGRAEDYADRKREAKREKREREGR